MHTHAEANSPLAQQQLLQPPRQAQASRFLLAWEPTPLPLAQTQSCCPVQLHPGPGEQIIWATGFHSHLTLIFGSPMYISLDPKLAQVKQPQYVPEPRTSAGQFSSQFQTSNLCATGKLCIQMTRCLKTIRTAVQQTSSTQQC